jgi:hypothetical protein
MINNNNNKTLTVSIIYLKFSMKYAQRAVSYFFFVFCYSGEEHKIETLNFIEM